MREDKSTSRDVSLTAVPCLLWEFPFTHGEELMERIHERLKPEGRTTVRDSSRRSFILLLLKYESLRGDKRTLEALLRSGPFFARTLRSTRLETYTTLVEVNAPLRLRYRYSRRDITRPARVTRKFTNAWYSMSGCRQHAAKNSYVEENRQEVTPTNVEYFKSAIGRENAAFSFPLSKFQMFSSSDIFYSNPFVSRSADCSFIVRIYVRCCIPVGKFDVEIKSFEKVEAFSSFIVNGMSYKRILFPPPPR